MIIWEDLKRKLYQGKRERLQELCDKYNSRLLLNGYRKILGDFERMRNLPTTEPKQQQPAEKPLNIVGVIMALRTARFVLKDNIGRAAHILQNLTGERWYMPNEIPPESAHGELVRSSEPQSENHNNENITAALNEMAYQINVLASSLEDAFQKIAVGLGDYQQVSRTSKELPNEARLEVRLEP